MQHPIDRIQWVDVDKLEANDYNPNHVFAPEMNLLAHSILTNGWIQPILVDQNFVVIDGFHRATLGKINDKVRAMTEGKVPVVVMEMDTIDRIMLTVRINRAKGQHGAVPMQSLVRSLVEDHGCDRARLRAGMGMNDRELDVLLSNTVFHAMDTKAHIYSDAWHPDSRERTA